MTNSFPNALIVGPRKSGTSWVHEYLKSRDDVDLPEGVKETFFFDQYHAKGLKWYSSHFKNAKSDALTIEVAPTYFEDPHTPERIQEALGMIPIVVILRDPAVRTHSLYLHLKRYGQIRGGFRKAVQENNLLTGSLYAQRLEHWWQVFGKENVQVLLTKDLADNPEAFTTDLNEFLKLPDIVIPDHLKSKYYEAATSPNYYIAKITNIVAQTLRSMRLYSVVNWLKNTPLKALIFGKPNPNTPKETLSSDDRAWLLENGLRKDLDALEIMLDRSIKDWKI